MASWFMMNFQDASSPMMEQLNFFHDYCMMFMILILIFICLLMLKMIFNKIYFLKFMNSQTLEIIWTIMPMLILMNMSIPSITNLYFNEEMNNPFITIKIISYQWFWSFEYTEFYKLIYDSFMINNYKKFDFRLLETDNHLIIPFNMNIRLIITSYDVIHSFSMPSLGIKIDSCPGRLNQINLNCLRPGIYFGQCSEICGINHSFMPIMMESTNMKNFIKFLINK